MGRLGLINARARDTRIRGARNEMVCLPEIQSQSAVIATGAGATYDLDPPTKKPARRGDWTAPSGLAELRLGSTRRES